MPAGNSQWAYQAHYKAGPMSRNSWPTQNGLHVFFYGLFILFLRETETEAQTDRIWVCGKVGQTWEKLGEEKLGPKYSV